MLQKIYTFGINSGNELKYLDFEKIDDLDVIKTFLLLSKLHGIATKNNV